MISLYQITKEQLKSLPLIFRLAMYDLKIEFAGHYFGILWHILNPLTQVLVYWLVFGIGLKGGEPVDGVPYIIWLLCGMIPWFFISPMILKGAGSVERRLNLVSKMNFPMSALPVITIVTELVSFFVMMAFLMLLLFTGGLASEIQWLQLGYYTVCMIVFVYAFSLFNSTISVLFVDYRQILQAASRILIYVSPLFWSSSNFNEQLLRVMALNPFFYIIEGFRYSLLPNQEQFCFGPLTLYFWGITLFLLVVGSMLHMKYRKNFVDYL